VTDYYVQMHGQYADGRPWSVGQHVTSAQSPDALNTTWSNAVQDFWTSATHGVELFYPVGTTLTLTTVKTLNATMHQIAMKETIHTLAGTAAGDSLPYQESILVSWRGDSIQKTGRGRWYLPALEETFVNNNVVTPTTTARIKAAALAVIAAINADGSTFFVTPTNVKKPPKNGVPLYTKTVVTTPLVSNKPARQSRRTNKVQPVYS
jgi:hypothetical protein